MIWLALLCALIAFALFGLSTDDHHKRRFGTRPELKRRRLMLSVAWLLLSVAMPLAVASHGWVFGPIIWFGLVMISAGLVFLGLNFTTVAATKGVGNLSDGRQQSRG